MAIREQMEILDGIFVFWHSVMPEHRRTEENEKIAKRTFLIHWGLSGEDPAIVNSIW